MTNDPDLLSKIASLRSMEEVEGFEWGGRVLGLSLTPEQQAALAHRKIELTPREPKR